MAKEILEKEMGLNLTFAPYQREQQKEPTVEQHITHWTKTKKEFLASTGASQLRSLKNKNGNRFLIIDDASGNSADQFINYSQALKDKEEWSDFEIQYRTGIDKNTGELTNYYLATSPRTGADVIVITE